MKLQKKKARGKGKENRQPVGKAREESEGESDSLSSIIVTLDN